MAVGATHMSSGGINKMWYMIQLNIISALKRKEILTNSVTWINFEDIILSEISQ